MFCDARKVIVTSTLDNAKDFVLIVTTLYFIDSFSKASNAGLRRPSAAMVSILRGLNQSRHLFHQPDSAILDSSDFLMPPAEKQE